MAVNRDRKVFSTQDTKIRQVFSLQQFRGLDKENKPLKVAPFRASDGYNFIIDSNVLKTRPAFKINEALPFVLTTGDYLIDWYEFQDIVVYVTRFGIKFNSSNKTSTVDFQGKKPMFYEEKGALFIFGLDDIYVAGVNDSVYVLYNLNNKTSSYTNLPDPYIPTLYVGDNAFEDINLLSKKSKYKVFAQAPLRTDGNSNLYSLPTVYTPEKNGTYSETVRFYNGLYDNRLVTGVYPVFLGIPGLDFTYSSSVYGNVVRGINVTDTFYPVRDFEYFEGNPPQPIYNQINLKKEDFFNLYINDAKQTAFEYAMFSIDDLMVVATANTVVQFNVPIKHNTIYRNPTTNFITSTVVEESVVPVYVQLKKFESIDYNFTNINVSNANVTVNDEYNASNFLDYPTFSNIIFEHNFTLNINFPTTNNVQEITSLFLSQSISHIVSLKDTCSNSSYISQSACEANGGTWRYKNNDDIWIKRRYAYLESFNGPVTYYSFSAHYKVAKDEITIDSELYTLGFNPRQNTFELRIKDYLYDYRGEPSIEVEVTFQNNPDYELISKNTFGIQFGSENRLFLAGHPDYPNIDRFNVSNDLLGNNVESQSYELSYFPSRNYRVVGGKGAINGYVVATDTSLYISKEEYPNDNKIFVRTRSLSEQGVVGYFEYKTSITKTPLNHRCFVRFYNDVIMLSKDGLYAIELTDNVLTSERMLKLRSGFINTDLKQAIANFDNKKIFIAENNYYMYIFINDVVYVADSRYIDTNQNASIGNVSYEIVKWGMNTSYKLAKLTETTSFLLDDTYSQIYTLVLNESKDDNVERTSNIVFKVDENTTPNGLYENILLSKTYFLTPTLYDTKIQSKPENVQFIFPSGFQYLASETTHYTRNGTTLTVIDSDIFRDITDGDILHYTTTQSFTVSGFEASNRTTMICPNVNMQTLYRSIANVPLYIVEIFTYSSDAYYRLDRYKPDSVAMTTTVSDVLTYEFISIPSTCSINYTYPIEMMWLSNINDFGNNFMEKTMFDVKLYTTKQLQENTIDFGYRTMRRLKTLDEKNKFDLSNNFNLNELNFNLFAINTFQESGMSLPMKENNFLYIQFVIYSKGTVELNGFHVLYKNNRTIKTIG
jgi:hypothetical protein